MSDDTFEIFKNVGGRKFYVRGDRDYNMPGNPVVWHGWDVTGLKNMSLGRNVMEEIDTQGDIMSGFSDKWKTSDLKGPTHGYPSTKAARLAANKFLKDLF